MKRLTDAGIQELQSRNAWLAQSREHVALGVGSHEFKPRLEVRVYLKGRERTSVSSFSGSPNIANLWIAST